MSAGVGTEQAVGAAHSRRATQFQLPKPCWATARFPSGLVTSLPRRQRRQLPPVSLAENVPWAGRQPTGLEAVLLLLPPPSEGAHRLAAHVWVNGHGACVAVQGTREQLVRRCSKLTRCARHSKCIPASLLAALPWQLPPSAAGEPKATLLTSALPNIHPSHSIVSHRMAGPASQAQHPPLYRHQVTVFGLSRACEMSSVCTAGKAQCGSVGMGRAGWLMLLHRPLIDAGCALRCGVTCCRTTLHTCILNDASC